MIKDKPIAKKRVKIYEEDDVIIVSYKTTGYVSIMKCDDF